MEYTATRTPVSTGAWELLGRLVARFDAPAASAWTLAFALVAYLAMRGGGYDTVVRSDVGIAVWWIVLLGALAGILPARIGRAGWVAIGLLAGFALWTGLAVGWSQSAEQSVLELGRIATYLGVLVLAIALQGRAAARHTINGLACAIGLVTVLAVLSRLHPQAFGPNLNAGLLNPESLRRLSYPLNYWNALAAFAAMGVPLLLAIATGGRTLLGRALAAAILPVSTLCLYLTVSRGGVIELAVGVAVFLLIVPRRLEAFATLAVAGWGAALLVWATSKHPAVTNALHSPAALHAGTRLFWLAVVVCAGVGLLQVAIALCARHVKLPAVLTPSRNATTKRALSVAAVAVVVAVAAGAPGALSHAWHDFKQPPGRVAPASSANVFDRLQAANGNSRYQFWQAALHANATSPWLGIGPGTFGYWWNAHATTEGYVVNAHSLYFETLAETGIVGLALLGGTLLCFAGVAVRRATRARPGMRVWIAGAVGGLAAFLVAAALDWVWQLAAIAAAALVLGAVIVAGRDDDDRRPAPDAARPRAPRAVLALLALAALAAVVIPLSETLLVRESQAAADRGNLNAALADSIAAVRVQPYAASAHLQEALVLEAAGDLGPAATAARVATTDSPTDWTTWLTLARIDARHGDDADALAALGRARSLNPYSALFKQT